MIQGLPDVSWGGGVPYVNKFEQVTRDGHQMSLAGGGQARGGVPCLTSGERGGGLYSEESITFPQLHWQAVIKLKFYQGPTRLS